MVPLPTRLACLELWEANPPALALALPLNVFSFRATCISPPSGFRRKYLRASYIPFDFSTWACGSHGHHIRGRGLFAVCPSASDMLGAPRRPPAPCRKRKAIKFDASVGASRSISGQSIELDGSTSITKEAPNGNTVSLSSIGLLIKGDICLSVKAVFTFRQKLRLA